MWGYDFGPTSNSLDVYVGYLRRKTEAGGEPRLIQTVRGVGYALREPARVTLRTRLALTSAAAVAIAVAIVSAIAYLMVRNELRGGRQRARAPREQITSSPSGLARSSRAGVPDHAQPPLGGAAGYAQIVDPSGRAVAQGKRRCPCRHTLAVARRGRTRLREHHGERHPRPAAHHSARPGSRSRSRAR